VTDSDDPYVYPGTQTLRNRLGTTNPKELDRVERSLVTDTIAQGIPQGAFDLAHLRAIHRHLFQDVYDWAGQLRTVEINKGGHQFQFRQYIEMGMGDVHRRLVRAGFLKGLPPADFAREAGVIMGDVNYVHPFREGNGRTQAQYLKQLAARAGHTLDLKRIDPAGWIDASKVCH
jgi:cell filamentation protein